MQTPMQEIQEGEKQWQKAANNPTEQNLWKIDNFPVSL